MAKKLDLSIIIVNYNTRDLLRQCLASLPLGVEIIVVDNGSADGSAAMVRKKFPQVRLIANKKNLGYGQANNQGLKKARGKFILFLNSDTVVPKKVIPVLMKYLKTHPRVGVITPKLILRNGKIDPDCHRGFPTPWAAFCYFLGLESFFPGSKIFGQYHQTWKNLKAVHEIDACCGAFLLTRKKILDEIGGFDEKYFFYGEDLDLCYRIRQLAKESWSVVYYPKVEVIHYKGASSGLRPESADIARVDKQTRLKVFRSSGEAMEIFYDKFYKDQYPSWLTWLVKLTIKLQKSVRILKAKRSIIRTKKRVGIDARMMGLKHAGIGRYIENLAANLKKTKTSQLEIVLLQDGGCHYSWQEQIFLPWLIWRSGLDLVHFPHFNVPFLCPKPFVVTIHDLIKHRFRALSTTTRSPLVYGLKFLAYLLVFRLAVKRARKIIVPSQAVKKELLIHYRLNPAKIIVIHEAASSAFRPGRRQSYRPPLLVYTGSLYPHKNVDRLLRAVKSLPVNLAIVCARSIFWQRTKKKIKKMKLSRKVKLLGFVPDRKLVALYHRATAFVQPSLMEGFNLTAIEAMASGLAVIVSDIPVHREICGQAAVFFHPYDEKELAEKIKKVVGSVQLRRKVRQKGLRQAKKYSWSKTAQETLKVYENCLT